MIYCTYLYSYCRLLRNKSCERMLYTGRHGSLRSSMPSFFLERVSIANVSIQVDTVSPGIPIRCCIRIQMGGLSLRHTGSHTY